MHTAGRVESKAETYHQYGVLTYSLRFPDLEIFCQV